MHNPIFFVLLGGIFFSCSGKAEEKKTVQENYTKYNLSTPQKIYKLGNELNEISGMEYLGNQTVACVQDEEGKIFIYNLATSTIDRTISFSKGGDYEDIAKVKDDYYILRSDGTLFRKNNEGTFTIETHLKKEDDTESLCYDSETESLIMGSKKGDRNFYKFNLADGSLIKTPLFSLKRKNFSPTAIDIHPQSKELFILSKGQLAIADKEGNITTTLNLNSSLFPQPEGLAFKEDGTLLISNEAAGGTASILEFNYQKP